MAFTLEVATSAGTNNSINLSTTRFSNPALAVRGTDGKIYYAPMKTCETPNADELIWKDTAGSTPYVIKNLQLEKYLICCFCMPAGSTICTKTICLPASCVTQSNCGLEAYIYPSAGFIRCAYNEAACASNCWYVRVLWQNGVPYMFPLMLPAPGVQEGVIVPVCNTSCVFCLTNASVYSCQCGYARRHSICNTASNGVVNETALKMTLTGAKGGANNTLTHTWAVRQGMGMNGGNFYDAYVQNSGSCNLIFYGYYCVGATTPAWNVANVDIAIPQNCWGRYCQSAQTRCSPKASVITNIKPNSGSNCICLTFCNWYCNAVVYGGGLKGMPSASATGPGSCAAWTGTGAPSCSCSIKDTQIYCACKCRIVARSCCVCLTSIDQGCTYGWCNNAKWNDAPNKGLHACHIVEICGWRVVE